jgi:hypothetical protein
MLIASTPHPRSHRSPPAAELGKSVSMRQALAILAQRRPHAIVLSKRRFC